MVTTEAGSTRLRMRRRWRDISVPRFPRPHSKLARDHDERNLSRIRELIYACLEAKGGEVTARSRAVELGTLCIGLSDPGRRKFLEFLAKDFDVDHELVVRAARQVVSAQDAGDRLWAECALRVALEPPRVRLLSQFNTIPGGTKFLVDLRAHHDKFGQNDESLIRLDEDLKNLLATCFDVGSLELRRITWDSPASLLEKLAQSEAVHAVTSLEDLKNRFDTDRRVFAFFHSRMPDEPLIFVEVAFVNGLASQITTLLDTGAPRVGPMNADTAIFYSISRVQPGMKGISLGALLIKEVVGTLSREIPQVRTYATLSPVPGFHTWLVQQTRENIAHDLPRNEFEHVSVAVDDATSVAFLVAATSQKDWWHNARIVDSARQPLLRCCARYLLYAKRSDERTLDPVANFHLTNGARIEQINWLADPSEKGIADSLGLMVNYVYALGDIDANHQAYTSEGVVATSPSVVRLASKGGK